MTHRHSSRVAVIIAAALLPCLVAAPAHAAIKAGAVSGTQAAGSGQWSAVATTAGAAPFGTGALALTFTAAGTDRQYFNVVNTGTLSLTGETFTATTTRSSAAVERCSTTWDESTGTCPSGTITTVMNTGASPTALNAPLAATGTKIRLRVRITAAIQRDSTITIGVTVSRSQVRTANTTTS
ncbi:hypothetical protein ABFP37_08950 [Burkholderia sp. RS01]|uniref:hypothetical protein n=1 Tax=unclassified Burkholderia TaxID=2613784 RepID=UPI003218B189